MITEAFGGKILLANTLGLQKMSRSAATDAYPKAVAACFFSLLLYLARSFSKREYVRFG